jgi:hypothetical protein
VIGPLAASIVSLPEGQDIADALRVAAERALRAGVRPTLSEWAAMSEAERSALEWARRAVSGGEDDALARALDQAGAA